jgi:NAD(P)H-hydrate epimerase
MKRKNKPILLSVRQAKEIDKKARELLGISTLVLMENAGRAVAEELMRMPCRKGKVAVFCGNTRSKRMLRCAAFCSNTPSKRMLRCAIFCGKGNNGGDGFVAARHLLLRGIRPDIFLAADIGEVKNEARTNLDILLKLKQEIFKVRQDNLYLVKSRLKRYSLIVDALLGIGLVGQVNGMFGDLIGMINIAKAKRLAVDVPSGLDADNGKVLGRCIKADTTVTFVDKKRGMVVGEGPKYCGRIVVKDLGVPL